MSVYETVDGRIRPWAERHSLNLLTIWGEREIRSAYLWSAAGECFQIWVEPPVDGKVGVGVSCVEGRYDLNPDLKWTVAEPELDAALERALQTAKELMSRP